MDVQKVIRQPQPNVVDSPQFRVEDFARVGYRIALALGQGPEFCRAIGYIRRGQKAFTLEEDHLLVVAIQNLMKKSKTPNSWRTVGQLWSELELCSPDPRAFERAYHNAVILGKKLWSLQESLKEVFDITWRFEKDRGARVWCIGEHDGRTQGSASDEQHRADVLRNDGQGGGEP